MRYYRNKGKRVRRRNRSCRNRRYRSKNEEFNHSSFNESSYNPYTNSNNYHKNNQNVDYAQLFIKGFKEVAMEGIKAFKDIIFNKK